MCRRLLGALRRDMERKGNMFRLACRGALTPRMVSRFEVGKRLNPSEELRRLVRQLQRKVKQMQLHGESFCRFSHLVLGAKQ